MGIRGSLSLSLSLSLRLALAVAGLLALGATPNGCGGATNLYISPTGNDINGGTDEANPVQSFDRIIEIVRQRKGEGNDIQVRIALGTWDNVSIDWPSDATMPDNQIILMPWADQFNDSTFVTFRRTNTSRQPFFRISHPEPVHTRTGLVLFHLKIEHYYSAVNFKGFQRGRDKNKPQGKVTHNGLIDCRIRHTGSLEFPDLGPDDKYKGFNAIGLADTANTQIMFNWIENVENSSQNPDHPSLAILPHGVYARPYADDSLIQFNLFRLNSGDSIKFRDSCYRNRVLNNIFINTSARSHGYQHYDKSIDGSTYECPSHLLEVTDNSYGEYYLNPANPTDYRETNALVMWKARGPDTHHVCSVLGPRNTISGNVNRSDTQLESMVGTGEWAQARNAWISANID